MPLIKPKGNETNETISETRDKKLRKRVIVFTNLGAPLLNNINDKHSSSLSVNERYQL